MMINYTNKGNIVNSMIKHYYECFLKMCAKILNNKTYGLERVYFFQQKYFSFMFLSMHHKQIDFFSFERLVFNHLNSNSKFDKSVNTVR